MKQKACHVNGIKCRLSFFILLQGREKRYPLAEKWDNMLSDRNKNPTHLELGHFLFLFLRKARDLRRQKEEQGKKEATREREIDLFANWKRVSLPAGRRCHTRLSRQSAGWTPAAPRLPWKDACICKAASTAQPSSPHTPCGSCRAPSDPGKRGTGEAAKRTG